MLTTRWIDGPTATEDPAWDQIDSVIENRGWIPLNRKFTRVLIKELNGVVIEFFVFQLMPHCGPMYVAEEYRGQGEPANLVEQMLEFLRETDCRGVLVFPENSFTLEQCRKYNMTRIATPAYIKRGPF